MQTEFISALKENIHHWVSVTFDFGFPFHLDMFFICLMQIIIMSVPLYFRDEYSHALQIKSSGHYLNVCRWSSRW